MLRYLFFSYTIHYDWVSLRKTSSPRKALVIPDSDHLGIKTMNRAPSTKNQHRNVICQDAADGTGDLIVPLPDDLLSEMGLVIGGTLTVEKQPDGTLTLTKTTQATQG